MAIKAAALIPRITPPTLRPRVTNLDQRSSGSLPSCHRHSRRGRTWRRSCGCIPAPRAGNRPRRPDLRNARRSLQLIPWSRHRARARERALCALDPTWLSSTFGTASGASCICLRPRPGFDLHGRRESRGGSQSWRARFSCLLASSVWRVRSSRCNRRSVYRIGRASESHAEASSPLAQKYGRDLR